MKKSIIFIICFFSIFSRTNAFFWEPSSLDLYKNIDEWIYELEEKMLWFELNWWERNTWILKEINTLAIYNELPECLDESKEISIWEFKKITTEENIYELTKYFSESCYSAQDEKYSSEMTNAYMLLFKKYLIESIIIAENKTNKIHQISNIWLYSDGSVENSWFDLIKDIEDIDNIIFSKVTEYEWEKNENLDGFIDMMSEYVDEDTWNNKKKLFPVNNYSYINNPFSDTNTTYNPIGNDTLTYDSPIILNTTSNYICLDNKEKSWLNDESITNLFDNIEEPIIPNINSDLRKNNSDNIWNLDSDNPFWVDFVGLNSIWFEIETPESDYVKVIDNSDWPCDDFYCISIDFITYNSSIFWLENMTIEYLIKRSNNHLSKFASTSLIPAKMSSNQFELWLESLDLPNIFHLGIQILKKPIPILNIEKQWQRDQTEFASKNLLEKYYKANWLDYKRRNSLVMLESTEQDKQNINNSVWLTIDWIISNSSGYYKYKADNNSSKTLNKIIEKKVSYWITENFEEQFTELDKFTSWIKDYTENLKTIIGKLEEIPIIWN